MNARDELEHDIRRSMPYSKDPESIAHHVAKWLHKDGYRKPRVVTTAEELGALPFESVLRDAQGHVLERWGGPEENVWVTVMINAFIPPADIALPATVLHEGATP